MGQHKTNPNSILKAQGKLQPRKRNLTAEQKRFNLTFAFLKAFNKVTRKYYD